MTLSFTDAIDLVRAPTGLSPQRTRDLLELLVRAELPETEGAALLKEWAERGETGQEVAAAVEFLRERSVAVALAQPSFDLCGTGGSGLSRFNISTTVAFVAAAAGVPVAKHGNRGSKRPNGSFDLLDELGVKFELSPTAEAQLQSQTGLCFLFARSHHPSVGRVVAYRKAAGCRSIFNLAGPLANPASISRQMIGTIDRATALIIADALQRLAHDAAMVVWGSPGIDEVSVTGPTGYLRIERGGIEEGELQPELTTPVDYNDLPGGDAKTNAGIFRGLLCGEERGPLLHMLVANAGAALDLWFGRAPRLQSEGTRQAQTLIDNGAAWTKFEEHKAAAQLLWLEERSRS